MTPYYSRNGIERLRKGEAADPESYDVSGSISARESFRGLARGAAVGSLPEARARTARITPAEFARAFGLRIVGATATGFRTRKIGR